MKHFVICFLVLVLMPTFAPLQAKEEKAKKEEKKEQKKEQHSSANSAVTTHTIKIGGKPLTYEATAGTIALKGNDGKEKAKVFYIAYVAKDVEDKSKRPLTFSFNGGPGSSSVWLHLGVFGPRRVVMNKDGSAPPPPARLTDNEFSILDKTDLVFIDPVTTGYSRAIPHEKAKNFHGVNQDIESVGDFLRLYTTRNKRWASPKYIAGESYGTTRAAGLVAHMAQRYGMFFNGIVLVSAVLQFQTIRFKPGNDLPYVLFLPTYTATAWYHKLLPLELQKLTLPKVVQAAREFAEGPYALALFKGRRLSGEDRENTVKKVAMFTGLREAYVRNSDLRIPLFRYTKEVLRSKDLLVGRMDSRLTGHSVDPVNDIASYDPSLSTFIGHFGGALNHYVRAELEYESDLPYEVLTGKVHPWDWGHYKNQFVDVATSLRRAFCSNPNLRVFVANGYYDGATPFFATEYTFDHMSLPGQLPKNVTMRYYEAGHMMYSHEPSLIKMKNDLTDWLSN